MKRPAGAEGSDYNPEASVLDTDYSVVEGVNGNAIRVETGSFLYLWHGLSVDAAEQHFNSDGTKKDEVYIGEGVNNYTVMMDVKVPDLTKVYTLFEVNPFTTSGGKSGEIVITDSKLGADYSPYSGQYSTATVEADKWHRIAYVADVYFSADSLIGSVKIYLDGVVVNEVAYGSVDGSSSPYGAMEDGSGDDDKAAFKVSGNNEGDGFDNTHDIDNLIIFDRALTEAEMAAYGGADAVVGISPRHGIKDLLVYPNPASDILTVDIEGRADFKLFNNIGQMVVSKSVEGRTDIDVRSIEKGLYIVLLKTESGEFRSTKVIIQ